MAYDNIYLASGGAQLEVNKQREEQRMNDAKIAQEQEQMRRQAAEDSDIHAERLQQMAARNLEMQQKADAINQAKQEEALLKKAALARANEDKMYTGLDMGSRLADNMIKTGQELQVISPTKGLAMIKEGVDAQHKSESERLQSLQILHAKHEFLAGTAMGIKDQETLEQAIPEFAKAGIDIPHKYQVWTDQTKAWFEQKMVGSEVAQKQIRLDLETGDAKLKAQKEIRLAKTQEQEQLLKSRRMAAMQANKTYKEPPSSQLFDDVTELGGISDDFKDLDRDQQIAAAKDYGRRAFYHQRNGVTDTTTAFALAKQDVLDKISDGKYLGFSADDNKVLDDVKDNKSTGNVEATFKSDPSMKGFTMGNKTPKGYEVLDKSGKVVGHYN